MKLRGLLVGLGIFLSSLAMADAKGVGTIIKVVDGDTYRVQTNFIGFNQMVKLAIENVGKTDITKAQISPRSKTFTVRLGGINTPESKHPDKSRNTQAGVRASEFADSFYGKEVVFHCWDMGKYGRAICSLAVDGKDIGLSLIEEGHSPYVTCWGKHPTMHRAYLNAAGKEYCHYK